MYFTHPQFKKFSLRQFFKKISEADLKNKLDRFFPNRYIVFTDLGRSAFQIAIKELGLENSEMLVPAYLCDIFLPIFGHYNIKPIYLDIDLKTFNIQISEIENKIAPQTKSILISHTYGLPNNMAKISEIAKKYNLKIIEDCAHCFSSSALGQIGNCAFFSLSKIIPSINGGILIFKKPIEIKLPNYRFKLRNVIKFLRLFPVLAGISEVFRPNRNQRGSKGIQGENSMGIPRRASKGSLKVFNWYLDNFEEQIGKRKKLAEYFQKRLKEIGFEVQESEDNVFTYLSALVPENFNRDELFNKLKKKNIFCSRIWHKPIYLSRLPADPNLPNTAEAAKRIVNFPLQNWFTEKEIEKIISGILSEMS